MPHIHDPSDRRILASTVLDRRDGIVKAAETLASILVHRLESIEQIDVSMEGFRGAPSSFFNVLITTLSNQLGKDAFLRRVNFQFDSEVQESVFRRSLHAILNEAA